MYLRRKFLLELQNSKNQVSVASGFSQVTLKRVWDTKDIFCL